MSIIDLEAQVTLIDLSKHNLQSAKGRIEKILHTCAEGTKTINEVLKAAKEGKITLREADLNSLVNQWMLPFNNAIREKDIKLSLRPGENMEKIFISAPLIRQAFQNVCLNAIKEIGIGDALVIVTSQSNSETWIEIRDGGPGFPSELLGRRRPPFIVEGKKEKGLGLTIVHRIMQLHQGRLELGKSPEKGANVRLIIPKKIKICEK